MKQVCVDTDKETVTRSLRVHVTGGQVKNSKDWKVPLINSDVSQIPTDDAVCDVTLPLPLLSVCGG